MQAVPVRYVHTPRTVYGPTYSYTYENDSYGMVEWVGCGGVVHGDFKSANPFWFRLHRQYGDGHDVTSHGFLGGNSYTEGDSSGLRIFQVAHVMQDDPGDVDWPRTDDTALASIFDQIRGNSNLAVDILEGGSTVKMLSNLRKLKKEVIKTVVSTKKSKRYKGLTTSQERLDFFTSKWLEGRYGWMPLIHSTYDAVETLGKRFSGRLVPVRGRSTVKVEKLSVSGSPVSIADPLTRELRTLSYRTEVVCLFSLPEANQLYDWTTLSPATLAWELAPLSFVADWFVNVGDLLSLWENHFIFASKFVRGYRTRSYKELITTRRSASYSSSPPRWPEGTPMDGIYARSLSGGDRVIRKYMNREVLYTLPLPSQGIRVRPELNAKRMLDAVSLFHTFTKSEVRKIRG